MIGDEASRKGTNRNWGNRASRLANAFLFFFVTFCAVSWLTLIAVCHASARDLKASAFEPEIVAFEKWDRQNAVPRDCILFVGSSSIRLWQTAESFPELPVVNRGFGGSTIADVNRFADRIVFKYEPRLIVFYSGDNDIAGGKSPDTVFTDFQTFVNSVHEQLPETSIIYLPIKPSVARWKLWPKMQIVNARVQDLAKSDDRLTYVDTATPLLGANGGEPPAKFFLDDGLHLNAAGYELWNDILRGSLRQ
jgi:lysophospholipase L1-like esterase